MDNCLAVVKRLPFHLRTRKTLHSSEYKELIAKSRRQRRSRHNHSGVMIHDCSKALPLVTGTGDHNSDSNYVELSKVECEEQERTADVEPSSVECEDQG